MPVDARSGSRCCSKEMIFALIFAPVTSLG
jgi:hypothetical protein